MPRRECLNPQCRALHSGPGPRCPTCTSQQEQARAAARGTTTQRGLGADHQAAARQVLATAELCAKCGLPPTADDPLEAGHRIARVHGGTNDIANYQPEHRSCNRSQGAGLRRR
ncbi:HNH endonuclease signature motif containing protein [Streptosporangium canum]|uniref:HNH endonuclease signature motif containing protein n=1 Tax=Streptosporangium canum TaxID=324952 RepID=UPI00341A98FA